MGLQEASAEIAAALASRQPRPTRERRSSIRSEGEALAARLEDVLEYEADRVPEWLQHDVQAFLSRAGEAYDIRWKRPRSRDARVLLDYVFTALESAAREQRQAER